MIFETVVIYDADAPIHVIYGQNSELLKTLQKTEYWETMLEELTEIGEDINDIANINQLEAIYTETIFNSYSIKIAVFLNQSYSGSKQKELK